MTEKRQLRLGAFMRPVSIHTAWWRYPGSFPDANFNFQHLKRFAQTLERGKFDAFFMADHLAVLNMPMPALMRSATVTSFDPLTLLPALAVCTERLGLIATASTTFDTPYHIARRFASLDHISNGRAAWNVVTTSNPDAALNFGLEEHMDHGERYQRARRENLTVRQLAQIAGSYGGLSIVGTPATIADQREEWLFDEACDGFNVMFPYVPGGLDEFVDRVVPELQRRDSFRREYEGTTLREHLGLPRPKNRFFP